MKVFALIALCVSLCFLGFSLVNEAPLEGGSGGYVFTRIWSLPEMDEIPQTKDWKENHSRLTSREEEVFRKEWEAKYPDVKEYITAERVRDLSRWSREAMVYYQEVNLPEPERLFWLPVCRDETGSRVLLSTTLEPLPGERPLHRDLKAFVLFDTNKLKIVWILVTIRSEI
ncbi:MAG: hypothetical protein Q4E67_05050 [Planctomycetia bacterium]|nr:hypothetical protein [Planctomycetia bacterium]